MYTADMNDALLITQGTERSILRGGLRTWVASHLLPQGAMEGDHTVEGDTVTILTDEGPIQFANPNPPQPSTPTPTQSTPNVDITTPPPIVPTPDIPGPPTTTEEWRAVLANTPDKEIGVVDQIQPDETPAAYSARVLSPLGLTIAELARNKPTLEGALATSAGRTHPEWTPILEAAGITPPTQTNSQPPVSP
jgi:hypothetical protein